MNDRIVGMSKKNPPAPLLGAIAGRSTRAQKPSEQKSPAQKPGARKTRTLKIGESSDDRITSFVGSGGRKSREPLSVDADPLSSSNDEGGSDHDVTISQVEDCAPTSRTSQRQASRRRRGKSYSEQVSDIDDAPERGDIKPTRFGPDSGKTRGIKRRSPDLEARGSDREESQNDIPWSRGTPPKQITKYGSNAKRERERAVEARKRPKGEFEFKKPPDDDALQSPPTKKSTIRRKLKIPKPVPESSPAKNLLSSKAFKMPADLSDLGPISDDKYSDVFSDGEHGDILKITEDTPMTTTLETRCPMCNEQVDKEFYDKLTQGSILTIREQGRFCRLHKKKTAEDIWTLRGYPSINWDKMQTRIGTYHPFIQDILEGAPCHYDSVLLEKIKTGKNRNLSKTATTLAPGYYGPRGFRAMSENIIENFSALLRKRAVKDRLVSARGFSGYLQTVLVPELTVKLIMEDMKVGPEEARTILTESIRVGELLNEDLGDTVIQASDDESESEVDSVHDW